MPQRYRAAVRRFGSRRIGIVWPSVWRQQAEGAADRNIAKRPELVRKDLRRGSPSTDSFRVGVLSRYQR
jgi:hypothetical protein